MAERVLARPITIWLVNDGKPGHQNQSLGLAEALARARPGTSIHTLAAQSATQAMLALLLKRAPGAPAHLPSPDLLLGAGHATHLALLALRHARGGRAIVLMNPSLPRRLFDLCVLPAHDGIAADAGTLVTEGALNRMRPHVRTDATRTRGLMLIGGASPHFAWDSHAIEVQINSVLARTPDIHWTLTTSRRTPDDFAPPASDKLTVVPWSATSPDWLPAQLANSDTAWVTPDSASMVFEALTAGADVGVFDLPVNPRSRVAWAVARLADAQRITRFTAWCAQGTLHPNVLPLAEADRCAAEILDRLETQR